MGGCVFVVGFCVCLWGGEFMCGVAFVVLGGGGVEVRAFVYDFVCVFVCVRERERVSEQVCHFSFEQRNRFF